MIWIWCPPSSVHFTPTELNQYDNLIVQSIMLVHSKAISTWPSALQLLILIPQHITSLLCMTCYTWDRDLMWKLVAYKQWMTISGKMVIRSAVSSNIHRSIYIWNLDWCNISVIIGDMFPPDFLSIVQKIHKYIFHILAHIYYAHYQKIVIIQVSCWFLMPLIPLRGHFTAVINHFTMAIRHPSNNTAS